ncbi:Disease resistance protein RGA2 [Ananas comosus]|uniref:Disease resistance protein RGA2 n=1 Tax=Ananas comosus TaxID=4615 RepID=A0A199V5R2_ANACO|nr:Disease resistance protein RGA2 [Ananas comosus]
MQDELERLQHALPQVQAVLTAVEDGAMVMAQNKALDTWLWQLRDAVECAEDVLDELEYYELEKTVQDRDDEVRGILSKCRRKFDSFVNRIFSDDTLKRLREAVKGLDRVVAGMGPLLQLVIGLYGPGIKRRKIEEVRNARETSSLLTESEVLGRDEERDLIVEWLIKPRDTDVSAFTIVGMGGFGKTTLAQLVYSDERVREYFDPIMWVCVSQDFDAAVITRKMLEGASSESFGDKSLNALHYILKQKILSKRFLLMLDDVWNDDNTIEWEKLVAPLKFGQRGSKILLTTRMGLVVDMVAKVMQCKKESLNINGLEESNCMLLFNKHAFLGVNPDDYKNLRPIGEQIVKKLGGCPLAIKVTGGLLNSCMDYDYWKRILKKDIVELQHRKDDIMTILRLSYDHLPTNLQLCFRYCSIFRRILCLRGKSWSICGRVQISNLKKLRTLVISIKKNHDHSADHALVFNEVIKGFKSLRLFSLYVNFDFHRLLDALYWLIHLRYLSLTLSLPLEAVMNKSFMNLFPQSLFRLYHLVVMKFSTPVLMTSRNIEYDGLTNLVNLRLLDLPRGMIKNIRYVSKLSFIRKLEYFFVQEESGYKISELKNLRDLRRLNIRELENVRTSEEATLAKLNEKEYLKSLLLGWSSDCCHSAEADEQLLDNLCPHINVRKLRIEEYKGVKSPCWMTDLYLINLTCIQLVNCKEWEHLPPLGGLPSLNIIRLKGLVAVKQIGCSFYGCGGVCAFPSLKQLFLLDMPNLEEWIGIADGCIFPQLHTMVIRDCPNLRGMLTLPRSLRLLLISHVGLTALPAINQDCKNDSQQEHVMALESLIIEQCEKLNYFPTEFFGNLSLLKFLSIEKCPKLTKCGITDIQPPSALDRLIIGSCGDLEVALLWSANLTFLTWLDLLNCASIASLPPAQVCAQWTMLSHLAIKNCKELSSLGGIQALISLCSLEIEGCDKLIEVSLLRPPFPNNVSQKNPVDCFLKLGRLSIDHHALLLMEPLRSLTFISSLTLSSASQLTSLPEEWILQNCTALKILSIRNAVSLQSLTQSMTNLCSLENLAVYNANLIRSLPDLPISLCTLCITGCHPVLKERCQENIGLDWPKIANIRYDELERLQLALPQVQAVLTAVEEGASVMAQNKALETWLWQLRDAVENAEDVLDELEYYELQKKTIRDRDDKVRGILSNCKRKFDSFVNRIFSDDTLKRLREAVKGLDRVIAGMGPLLQLVTGLYGPGVKRQKLEEIKNARETSSLLTESEVLGRDKERDLIESDCMTLFNKHAFLGVNPDDYKNLQLIGEHIATKLGGCPLAIKVMGGMLNSCMDYEYWKKILEKDNMKLQQGNGGIMTVLRLSYDHLTTNLQLCFRYCSLFPQDHMFKRKKLVNMWIGSGLIPQSICGRQRPEDIGKEYLNLLTRKSFFTCETSDNGRKITKQYFMHDLLHDLAQSVSLGECIRVGGDVAGITIPRTVRHLSVKMVNLLSFKEISNLKNVRTLVIYVKEDNKHNADHALQFLEVIKRFKKLRLLILYVNFYSHKLPDALSSLIHLRYLSFSQGEVVNESIEYDGLTKLVNLRSLVVSNDVIRNIPFISKLSFIHKLENFIVREESGYKIGELKNLRDLRHLCIRKLEKVRSSEEAIEANLNEKKHLKSLSLKWSKDRFNSAEVDEQLLDNLCPHINLKKMRIAQYQGAKSPYWMTNLSLVNLTFIELCDCKGWEHLPSLGQFSSLQYLWLRRLHAVKQIDCSFNRSSSGCAFPSLKKLFFDDMPNLVEWIGVDDRCMFPQLLFMSITCCPNLREIPTLPYGLGDLYISNLQEHSQALENLAIGQCEKLEYVPPEFFGKFKAIKYLHIKKCPKLTKRGISDIQLPSVLNELTIGSCGDLEVSLLWSANLTSLTELELLNCARIASLPPAQVCARWTMLSRLEIKNCKELSSLGGIQALVSLHSLKIEGCDKLIGVALLQPPLPNDVGQKNAEDFFLKLGKLSIDHHALLLLEPLRSLSSINNLTISDASQLTSLPEEWLLQNHAALKFLEIQNASSLQSLPESMTKLCFLLCLVVHNTDLIQSLPDLPTSLRTLHITGCHPVLKERCQENIGLDWPKIAHIPIRMIE